MLLPQAPQYVLVAAAHSRHFHWELQVAAARCSRLDLALSRFAQGLLHHGSLVTQREE